MEQVKEFLKNLLSMGKRALRLKASSSLDMLQKKYSAKLKLAVEKHGPKAIDKGFKELREEVDELLDKSLGKL